MYNPYKNPDNTLGRRDRILKNMYEDGKISRREYKDARQETIVLSTAEPTKRYDAVETYACYCATRALMEQQGFEFRTDFSSEEDRKTYEDAYQEQYKTCHWHFPVHPQSVHLPPQYPGYSPAPAPVCIQSTV